MIMFCHNIFNSFYLFFVSSTSCILVAFISPFLCIHPLPLPPLLQNKIKFERKKKKKKRKISIQKLQCDPFVHMSTCKYSLVQFKVSGFCCTGTSLGQPIAALCHGDSPALRLQDLPFHVLLQIRGGEVVGVGHLINLILGLGSCGVGQPAPSHRSSAIGRTLQHCPC